MLASPVLKAMLQPGRFREGLQRNATDQLEVDLPDDDQSIMVIVLNIIHGRNRLVPKQADLEMMTKLAILVDKYKMVEVVVESFSDPWINDLLTKEILHNGRFDIVDTGSCGANLADKLDVELPIPETVISEFLE